MDLALTMLTLTGGALGSVGALALMRMIWKTDRSTRPGPSHADNPFVDDTATRLGTG